MDENICPKCNEQQYSPTDKSYLKLFNQCWGCDKKDWEKAKITTMDFENRERVAFKDAML